MSQGIFSTIVPTTTSGNQLAAILNDFKDAVVSGFSGSSRPSELDAGGYWIDTSDAQLWAYKMWTGVQDITIFTINLATGSSSIAAADSSFEIAKNSEDSVGPALKLLKERLANNGQTLDGDTLGELQFYATRDSGINVLAARIRAISSDNTTSSAQGSYLTFGISYDNTNTIVEAMRLIDGKLGLGITAPTEKLHVVGNAKLEQSSEDALSAGLKVKKKRVSNSGQVLSGDSIGTVEFISNDSDTNDVPAVLVEVSAVENHTASAHGSKISVKNKKIGQTSYTEQVVIGENVNVKTDLVVDGNLTVSGTTTTVNTTNLEVKDANILVNKGGTQTTANSAKAGLTVEIGGGTNAIIGYDSSKETRFVIGDVGSTSAIVSELGQQTLENKTIEGGAINNASITIPSKLEVKQDTEANLITYAGSVDGTDGQLVFAVDTKVMYQVIDGELAPVGGGGGGVSLNWNKSTLGPVTEFVDGFKFESFNYETPDQEIFCLLSVPMSYRSGKQITLKKGKFFCDFTGAEVFFKAQSTLVGDGFVLGSPANIHDSTNTSQLVNATQNAINTIADLDITDAVGEINGVPVVAGDKILIKLFRDSASEGSSAFADARLLIDSFEPSFS